MAMQQWFSSQILPKLCCHLLKTYWQRPGLSRLNRLSGNHFGVIAARMSQMTPTMQMTPASSAKLWPKECMHLVLKLLEAQNILTPKIG